MRIRWRTDHFAVVARSRHPLDSIAREGHARCGLNPDEAGRYGKSGMNSRVTSPEWIACAIKGAGIAASESIPP